MIDESMSEADRPPAPPRRLKKRPDFLRAAAGRKIHAALVSVHVIARSGASGSDVRVGFTVTKKVGDAVERNRIRRKLKDVVRTVPDLSMKPSHDYVIVARRDVLTAPRADIVVGLQSAIKRAHSGAGRGRGPAKSGKDGPAAP